MSIKPKIKPVTEYECSECGEFCDYEEPRYRVEKLVRSTTEWSQVVCSDCFMRLVASQGKSKRWVLKRD